MSQFATVTALPTGPRPIENCKQPGADPDAWFPPEPKDKPGRRAFEENARKLCTGCPLARACLLDALADEAKPGVDRHGIFGGLAPWERAEIATLEQAVA